MQKQQADTKSNTKKISRRKFIQATAASAAFMILPRHVLGGPKYTPPSEKITIGAIGVGWQGTYDMQQLMMFPDVQILAVCDVNEEGGEYLNGPAGRAPAKTLVENYYAQQKQSGLYKGCSVYNDFRQLLARDDIDAVTVCTPDHWHGLISVAAAQAGKDIYCEKPLVNTIAEGRAVCDAVQRYGRILQTGSHERANDSVRFACELVRNGRIGKLHTIRINMPVDSQCPIDPQPIMPIPEGFDYDMWLGPTPWAPYTQKRCHFWWRYQLNFGGGEMTDRGAHIIDLAQLGNDTDGSGPVEISAKGSAPEDGLFDTFTKYEFECKYDNGVRIIGSSSGSRGLKFEGTEGSIFIHIHGGRLRAEPASLLREFIEPEEIHLGRSPGHHRDFINAVKTRRQPMAPAEIGHRTASICHLINIAMLTESKLKWDPQTEQITNNAQAAKMLSRPMRSPWTL